jgi:hypothetical protein
MWILHGVVIGVVGIILYGIILFLTAVILDWFLGDWKGKK